MLAQIGTGPFVRYFTEIFGQLELELAPLELELAPLELELAPLELELAPLVWVGALSGESDETPVEQAPTAKTATVMMLVVTPLTMRLV